MKNNRNRENCGFTLIELIVVVAIMGVALLVGGYALSTISLARAKNCATEMNEALIRTRTESYSKDSATSVATVAFYRGTDGIYMKKSYESSAEKIGSSSLSVSYQLKNAADYVELSEENVVFSFNRNSGAFRDVVVNGTTKEPCKSIKISGGGKTYIITCYPQTGKTEMK